MNTPYFEMNTPVLEMNERGFLTEVADCRVFEKKKASLSSFFNDNPLLFFQILKSSCICLLVVKSKINLPLQSIKTKYVFS